VLNRLNAVIEAQDGFKKNQFGFRKGRSTEDILQDVLKVVESGPRALSDPDTYALLLRSMFKMHLTLLLEDLFMQN